MDLPVEEAPDNSEICYWFDRIPHEIRQVLMSKLDLGSFLNLIQCSTLFRDELYEERPLILDRYYFNLRLYQSANYAWIKIHCEADSRYRRINCYEGIIRFTKKSVATTSVHAERTRFPHTKSLRSAILVDHRTSELRWEEDRKMEDLVVQYLGSYLATFGNRICNIEIRMGSPIVGQINEMIYFEQIKKLPMVQTVELTNVKWPKTEILRVFELWLTVQLSPNISVFEISGTLDYDEEMNEYLRRKQIYVRRSRVYRESRGDFSVELDINLKEKTCHFLYDYKKNRYMSP